MYTLPLMPHPLPLILVLTQNTLYVIAPLPVTVSLYLAFLFSEYLQEVGQNDQEARLGRGW